MLFMVISLFQTQLISSYSPAKPITPSLSGLPNLLLTISSCSDDTYSFSTTDKELVTKFLSLQQSANLSPKIHFHFFMKSFLLHENQYQNQNTCAKNHHNKWPNRNQPTMLIYFPIIVHIIYKSRHGDLFQIHLVIWNLNIRQIREIRCRIFQKRKVCYTSQFQKWTPSIQNMTSYLFS